MNLAAVTWAHAVNSQEELNDALNSDVNMIEADIVLGKLNDAGPYEPVMAHPPIISSDLSLVSFLYQITAYNRDHIAAKGVKLDFKSIEVFEDSLNILEGIIPFVSYPVWLNADIICGPVNQVNCKPVNAERFFAGCERFDNVVLSIGWTTQWGPNYRNGSYTSSYINDMVQAIKRSNVLKTGKSITFPVRAGIAANSGAELHSLLNILEQTTESSLTIWSSQDDYVDIEKLRNLIASFGTHEIYLDVPAKLSEKLNNFKRTNSSGTKFPSILNFSLVTVCVLCTLTFLIYRAKVLQ